MPEKMSNEEIGAKIGWEGGVPETFIDYGIDPDNIEDQHLAELVKKYVESMKVPAKLQYEIESYLEDHIDVI